MNIVGKLFAAVGFLSLSFVVIAWVSGDKAHPVVANITDAYLPQMVKAPKAIKEASFASEKILWNMDTKERLERELTVNSYYHSNTVWALKMSKRYFPLIEKILKEKGIPDDFKYLAVAESTLLNTTSPAGAKGIWQFMPATAREMGLEVNGEVDERFQIEKATYAACDYIKRLYNSDGSWINAAAAYNVGPGKLRSSMNSQGETSYFDMNLNEETSRYVFRILALKEIISDPKSYGYYLDEEDYFQPIKVKKFVTVSQTVPSWADFAHQHGVTYRLLKYANPWLISEKLTIKNNSYKIAIPDIE